MHIRYLCTFVKLMNKSFCLYTDIVDVRMDKMTRCCIITVVQWENSINPHKKKSIQRRVQVSFRFYCDERKQWVVEKHASWYLFHDIHSSDIAFDQTKPVIRQLSKSLIYCSTRNVSGKKSAAPSRGTGKNFLSFPN